LGQRCLEEALPVAKLSRGAVVVEFASRDDVVADRCAGEKTHEEITAQPLRIAVEHRSRWNRRDRTIRTEGNHDLSLRPRGDDGGHDLVSARPPLLLILRHRLAVSVLAVARILPHVDVVLFVVVDDPFQPGVAANLRYGNEILLRLRPVVERVGHAGVADQDAGVVVRDLAQHVFHRTDLAVERIVVGNVVRSKRVLVVREPHDQPIEWERVDVGLVRNHAGDASGVRISLPVNDLFSGSGDWCGRRRGLGGW